MASPIRTIIEMPLPEVETVIKYGKNKMTDEIFGQNHVFITRKQILAYLNNLFRTRLGTNIAIILASILVMIIYSFVAPLKYTASTTLYQIDIAFLDDSTLANPLHMLSASQVTPIDRFNLVMSSRAVAKLMIQKQGLDKVLFAKQWDSKTGKWHALRGPLHWIKGSLYQLFRLPAWTPPDEVTLADYLNHNVDTTLSDADNTLSLSFAHEDPKVAKRVLSALVEDTNLVIQQNRISALDHAYKLISRKVKDTGNVDFRTSSAQLASLSLIEMMKAAAKSFEIGTLNPIRLSPAPTSPRPILNIIVGILIGGLIIGLWHLYKLTLWMIQSKLDDAE